MDDIELADSAAAGLTNRQKKPGADCEVPKDDIDITGEEHTLHDVAVEYPSVVRRTFIVVGVALALFCVTNLFPNLQCVKLTYDF